MKALYAIICILSFLIASCSFIKKDSSNLIKEKLQNKDPYLSNYGLSEGDGYSWKNRKVDYNNNNYKLTQSVLLSTKWNNGIQLLMFYEDNVYKYGDEFSGVAQTGNYSYRDNIVYFKPSLNYVRDGKIIPVEYLEFKYYPDLFLSDALVGDNKKVAFYAEGSSKIEIGDEIFIDGIKMIKTDKTFANGNLDQLFYDPLFNDKITLNKRCVNRPFIIRGRAYNSEKKIWNVLVDFRGEDFDPEDFDLIEIGWITESNIY